MLKKPAAIRSFICVGCGHSFDAQRSDARYCPECRHRDRRPASMGVGTGHGIRPARTFTCVDCGGAFMATRGDAIRCTPCGNKRKSRPYEERQKSPCTECGSPVVRRSSLCRKCASKLRSSNQPGPEHPSWKGGRTVQDGYVRIRVGQKYVAEHRQIVEERDGSIPDGWHVHHLNGIRSDNRSENLIAMSKSDHHKNHHAPWEERIRALEARIRELEGVR